MILALYNLRTSYFIEQEYPIELFSQTMNSYEEKYIFIEK